MNETINLQKVFYHILTKEQVETREKCIHIIQKQVQQLRIKPSDELKDRITTDYIALDEELESENIQKLKVALEQMMQEKGYALVNQHVGHFLYVDGDIQFLKYKYIGLFKKDDTNKVKITLVPDDQHGMILQIKEIPANKEQEFNYTKEEVKDTQEILAKIVQYV